MNKSIINKILELKNNKINFSVITNLENTNSYLFIKGKELDNEIKEFKSAIIDSFERRLNQTIDNTPLLSKIIFNQLKFILLELFILLKKLLRLVDF